MFIYVYLCLFGCIAIVIHTYVQVNQF